ncbi:HAD family phosphatase [Micromonospora sp. AMSO31t]|uniref:HAD family hydrolase n=1 Tax=Micromonospora sp. AMSO31t TaxID=2650566 RepID=UPI00124B6BE6|nr:HAD family phosphatase [Micromonospora sp. AMSO31t]KAB1912115.1 HAD family phosphatase [Micromonospora sp. AMSO31t]
MIQFSDVDLSAVRVLLCDADGNLFPSEEPAFVASVEVTNAFLAAYGVPGTLTAEQLRLGTTGKSFRTTAVDLCVSSGVPVEAAVAGGRPEAIVAPGPLLDGRPVLTAAALEHWVAEEKARVSAHLGEVLRPDPEVRDVLGKLAPHVTLAAVSSSACSRLAACFVATGLAGLIPVERRYSAEDSLPVPTSKPDPAIYLHAGRELSCGGAEGLAVEDSVPGARSAVAAGFPTVGNVMFVPEAERADRIEALRRAGVFAVVTSWRELADLLLPAVGAP